MPYGSVPLWELPLLHPGGHQLRLLHPGGHQLHLLHPGWIPALFFFMDLHSMDLALHPSRLLHYSTSIVGVLSQSPVEQHCISQHPSCHSPALHLNHPQLTSIRESSSPVTTNQAPHIRHHSIQTFTVLSQGYTLSVCISTHRLDPSYSFDVFHPLSIRQGKDKDLLFLSL